MGDKVYKAANDALSDIFKEYSRVEWPTKPMADLISRRFSRLVEAAQGVGQNVRQIQGQRAHNMSLHELAAALSEVTGEKL